MQSILSPDVETFSTPPSTPPILDDADLRPSISRRSSRPSSLRIQQNAPEWKPHIIVEGHNGQPSPEYLPPVIRANGRHPTPHTATQGSFRSANAVPGSATGPFSAAMNRDHGLNGVGLVAPLSAPLSTAPAIGISPLLSPGIPVPPRTPRTQPMTSPCFVHSRLQDPSMNKPQPVAQDGRLARLNRLNLPTPGTSTPNGGSASDANDIWLEEEAPASSVTRQLAETAVSVRETSKKLGEYHPSRARPYTYLIAILLGRTRLHSNIQSILIVTKARDNRLIKLTRELSLYLMLKPRKGGRGVVVYVATIPAPTEAVLIAHSFQLCR